MNQNEWYKQAVIYEIYVKSFFDANNDGVGDLKGVIHKLDYLEYLGVGALWLTPIFSSPFIDSGYDVSDYYSINTDFGSFSDFDCLISEAHKRNIKIIIDFVVNHTSDEHDWFKSAKKSKSSKYRDYYIWRDKINDDYPNNWISSRTGKSVWTYTEETDSYYLHLYTEWQPDLNWRNKDVRNEIANIIKFWCSKGVDGFRLDVINKIVKKEGFPNVDDNSNNFFAEKYFENQPLVHKYIYELRAEVEKDYPNCVFIGQTSGVDIKQAYEYTLTEEKQLDLFLQFEHTDFDKGPIGTIRKFDLEKFKDIIFKWQTALNGKLWNTIFLGSHDLPRMVSHYGNEDEYWEKSAKMLATVQLFLRGTQIIYMGDEIGMLNVKYDNIDDFRDIRTKDFYNKRVYENKENKDLVFDDIAKISRDNARYPMQWSNVDRQLKEKNSIFNYYRKLIKIRKMENSLIEGKCFELNFGDGIFAYKRVKDKFEMWIIANFTNDIINIERVETKNIIISNYDDFKKHFLRPYEVIVIKKSAKLR